MAALKVASVNLGSAMCDPIDTFYAVQQDIEALAAAAGFVNGMTQHSASYQLKQADLGGDFLMSGGALTCTTPASPLPSREYLVSVDGHASGANTLTIQAAAGYTINGQPSYPLSATYQAVTLVLVSASDFRVY